MKIISFIYIFALYILFIPGILIKNKSLGLLCSFLFSILLYFTLDTIDGTFKELLESKTESQSINVTFKNVAGDSPSNETQTAEYLVDAYSELYNIQANIKELEKMLNSYSGTNQQMNILQDLYNKIESTYQRVKVQIQNYDDMETQMKTAQNEVNNLEVQESNLQEKYNDCKIKLNTSNASLLEKKIATQKNTTSMLNTNKQSAQLNSNIIKRDGDMLPMETEYDHMKTTCNLREGFGSTIDVYGTNSLVDFQDKTSEKIKVQYDNDITHIPVNYKTGDQYIKILQSTTPSAMEELELKEKIYNNEGKDKKISELREKIVNLNNEIYQMQNTLVNYGNRQLEVAELKNKNNSTKLSITNLQNQLNICNTSLESNEKFIEEAEKKLQQSKTNILNAQKEFNTISQNNVNAIKKYNILQNNIANFNCAT